MASPTAQEISSSVRGSNGFDSPASDFESDLVREQLQCILSSPSFRNSRRYAAVLKYITEQTLAGNAAQLKERTIGVDVFGREHNYDTASDHVVRSAMAEVRKRLAQYYQQYGHEQGVNLELVPGSYVPQFRGVSSPIHLDPSSPTVEERSDLLAAFPFRSKLRWITPLAGVILLVGALLFSTLRSANDPLANFWRPVLASQGDVMLCIGNLEGGKGHGGDEAPLDLRSLSMGDFHHHPSQLIAVSDAIAIAKFTGFLQARNKHWRVIVQSEATFGDLRNGPAILIGLMNNNWTDRLVGSVRFRAERTGPRRILIRDTTNPARDDWSMDYAKPLLSITKDYAIVLRVFDPNTGQTVITASGISVFGTLAASEFLTDESELRKLDSLAPGWSKKNLELVLSTEVVRAKSGRPHILAAQVW